MKKQNKKKCEVACEVTTDNIFEDLGLVKSDELLAKAKLLNDVGDLIKASNLSQKEVAEKLGITQSMVSLLGLGRLSAFSIDTLLHYLYLLGCEVKISVKKPRSRVGIFRHRGCIAV